MSKPTDHFAAARTAIKRRLAQVIEENTTLVSALASLDSLERQAVEIAQRYSLDNPVVLAEPPKRHPQTASNQLGSKTPPIVEATGDVRGVRLSTPVRLSPDQVRPTRAVSPRGKAKPVKTKPRVNCPRAPYSPADDERIIAAGQGRANAAERFGSLALDMGRTVGAVERHYQELVKRPTPQQPVPPDVVAVSDPAYQPDRFRTVEVPEAPKTDKVCERCAGRPEGCLDDGLCMYEPQTAPDQLGSETTPIVEASQIEEVAEPIEPSPSDSSPPDHFDEAAASSEIVKAAREQEATKLRRPPEAPYNWPNITEANARVDPADIGRSLTGARLDNGPRDRRLYDHPDAYTSKNSD